MSPRQRQNPIEGEAIASSSLSEYPFSRVFYVNFWRRLMPNRFLATGIMLVCISVFVGVSLDLLRFALPILAIAILVAVLLPKFGFWELMLSGVVLVQLTSGLIKRSFPPLELLVSASALGIIILALLRGRVEFKKVPNLIKIPGAVYIIICLVSAVVPISLGGVSFGFAGIYSMILPVLAVYVGFLVQQDRQRNLNQRPNLVVVGLAIGLIVNCFVGYKQALFGLTSSEEAAAIASNSAYLVEGQARLMGAMPTNQDFGIMCGLVAPAMLLLALRTRGWAQFFAIVSFGNVLFLSFLTLLRGPLIAALAISALLILSPLAAKLNQRLRVLGWIVLIAPFISGLFFRYFPAERVTRSVDRVLSLFSLSGDSSFRARDQYTFPLALRAFDNNIFGSGLGAAGPVSQKYDSVSPYGSLIPDNGYLIIAIQVGLLGLVMIILAILGCAIYLLRAPFVSWGAVGASLLSLLLAFVFGGYWGLAGPMAVLGIFVGLALADRGVESGKCYEMPQLHSKTKIHSW